MRLANFLTYNSTWQLNAISCWENTFKQCKTYVKFSWEFLSISHDYMWYRLPMNYLLSYFIYLRSCTIILRLKLQIKHNSSSASAVALRHSIKNTTISLWEHAIFGKPVKQNLISKQQRRNFFIHLIIRNETPSMYHELLSVGLGSFTERRNVSSFFCMRLYPLYDIFPPNRLQTRQVNRFEGTKAQTTLFGPTKCL